MPKELEFKAKKAFIIPRGETQIIIPIPEKIIEVNVNLSIEEMRKIADKKAKMEAKDSNQI